MKKNVVIVLLSIVTISCLVYIFFIKQDKDETPNSNSNKSNIVSNSNSNYSNSNALDSNSNIESNNNSNIEYSNSNENQSNSNTPNSSINSNNISNKVSNSTSNKKSNQVSNSTSNKSNANSNSNNGLATNGSFSGVYKANYINIILFQRGSKLYYAMNIKDKAKTLYTNTIVSGKKVSVKALNGSTITLELLSNGVKVTNDAYKGVVPKKEEFTINDYYKNWLDGDVAYKNDSMNGVYSTGHGTISLFRLNKNKVYAKIKVQRIANNKYTNEYISTNGWLELNGPTFEDESWGGYIKIKNSGNIINVEAWSKTIEDAYFHIIGPRKEDKNGKTTDENGKYYDNFKRTYSKTGTYTFEQFINDIS